MCLSLPVSPSLSSSPTHQPSLSVTRRWRWASAAEAGGCWRSPKPCCSGATLSASRCPSRTSHSCSGASSLSPPARSAHFSLMCGRHRCIYCIWILNSSFPSFQLSPLLVSELVISKPKDSGKDTAGDHRGCYLTRTYTLVILIMTASQARTSPRFLARGLHATCSVLPCDV